MGGVQITYRVLKGYKYELAEDYVHPRYLPQALAPGNDIQTPFIHITPSGRLIIKRGYAWDGPSGPSIDTKSFMRGSLVHDALYQLIRTNFLDESARPAADALLREICLEDGMWKWRAAYVYWAVRRFAGGAAKPRTELGKIETAP